MAENRVVIKINYDAEKRKEVIDPKLVTVWHTKRILVALSLVLMTIGLLFWVVSGDDEPKRHDVSQSAVAAPQLTALPMMVGDSENGQSVLSAETKGLYINKGDAIILDKHVIRASLNILMKDGEPIQPLPSNLAVVSGQSKELFYFSETRHAPNGPLFHCWSKQGHLIQKKQINKQKSKFSSKYLVSQNDLGHWQVQLVDKKGKIYSQSDFNVIQQ